MRETEHIKDGGLVENVKFTRAKRKESTGEYHKSALTDHVAQHNHVIDWEGATLPFKDSNYDTRGIREAIAIRRAGPNSLNRDSGRHTLSEGYNDLLRTATPPSGSHKH